MPRQPLRIASISPLGRARLGKLAVEFLVVLLGVFAAQALSDWVQDRSQMAAMERAKLRADQQAAQVLYGLTVWKAALPCLQQRVLSVMEKASRGPIDPGEGERPFFRNVWFGGLSDQDELLLRQRYGDDRAEQYLAMGRVQQSLTDRTNHIATVWNRMMLASPEMGAVSADDRLAARQAAADILSDLRSIYVAIEGGNNVGRRLGLRAATAFDPEFAPARSCDAIWRSGRINPPRGMD